MNSEYSVFDRIDKLHANHLTQVILRCRFSAVCFVDKRSDGLAYRIERRNVDDRGGVINENGLKFP